MLHIHTTLWVLDSHGIDQRCFGRRLKTVHDVFADLVQEVVEWCAEEKQLQDLQIIPS